MTGAERVFAILIAMLAGTGLLLASRILEGPDKRRRQMFVYYTNLSNLAMIVVHVLLLIPGRVQALLLTPRARYLTTLCILVTFVIYFFVLTRFGRHSKKTSLASLGTRRFGNVFVHYLVPLSVLLEWLTVADKRGLGIRDALIWLAIPLIYLAYLVLRARSGVVIENTGSLWPYAIMDREALGTGKWLRNVAASLAGFLLLALLLLGVAALLT